MANEYFYVQTGVALDAAGGAAPSATITHNFGSTDYCCFEAATANPIAPPQIRFHTVAANTVVIENDLAQAWTGQVVLRRAHSVLSPTTIVSGAGTLAARSLPAYEQLFTGVTVPNAPGTLVINHNLGVAFANLMVFTGTVGAAAGPAVTRPFISDTGSLNTVQLNIVSGAPWTGDVWVMAFPSGLGVSPENHPLFGSKFGTVGALGASAYDKNRYLAGVTTLGVAAGVVNSDIVHNLGNAAAWQNFCLFGFTADPDTIIGPYVVAIDQGAVGTTTRVGVTAAGGNLVAGKALIGRNYSVWR